MNKERIDMYLKDGDLSKDDAIEMLKKCDIRLAGENPWGQPYVQILIDGQWLHLCRTDLKDDVCTYTYIDRNLEENRDYYLNQIRYGARIRKGDIDESFPIFAVIDSFSDG